MRPPPTGVRRSEHRLPPADAAGLHLHMRHAAPAAGSRGSVLLVHGATLASGLWDIALPGCSVLESLAAAGFSAWAPDIRGYGRSDRLAAPTAPYAGREEAVLDIAQAVDFACRHDGCRQLLLVGGSWGSMTTALYASRQPCTVAGLALMAPLYATVNLAWLRELADPAGRTRMRPALAPTRQVGLEQLRARWDAEVPLGEPARRRDPEVLAALLEDALAAEAPGASTFEVPNGTLVDLFEIFSGRAVVDASRLRMPVLLVRGEHDATSTDEDARRLFAALGSDDKQYLQIGDAGHFLCAERRAAAFRGALIAFAQRVLRPHSAAVLAAVAQ